MRASLTVLALGLLILATMATTGCGLKGDLYLPEDEPATASPEPDREQEDNEQSGSPAA